MRSITGLVQDVVGNGPPPWADHRGKGGVLAKDPLVLLRQVRAVHYEDNNNDKTQSSVTAYNTSQQQNT
jgi:hypothetical protein